ncbi:MAG: metallophosphoesterase [uncultured bacterium]|uniref:Calcineurin-like phosphoesterase domain-containing protein n=3 Tax=Candidatus Daviesiibacteriota TaxID=1752718 RepID=A0A0G0EW97_9BACT|nr:MAG: metallophosphoesterase [uncultured bacterium]KKQ09812.1 MAG: hypothetical protein US19_C0011G0015 [Candidatus Daviesbacteria bacterium GW2011_GWB1_36_5]OGE35579.1 MAG: hypothetical protein A3E66_02385 [Candidatus Daviesbacteria bacterium RIFCSPHIGHO2_12_FULL_37_16]
MFHKSHRRSGGGVMGIFRMFLSLIILAILGLGLLQAYKSFSGFDPLTLNPSTAADFSLTPDGIIAFIKALVSDPGSALESTKISEESTASDIKLKFAVIADPHLDYPGLAKALKIAKEKNTQFIIAMGDFSDVGTTRELMASRQKFDEGGLTYYALPGDHDLWDSRDKGNIPNQNFNSVFGPPYQAFSVNDVRFILVYNSDNYSGLDEIQLSWVEEEVDKSSADPSAVTFVFAATPLYHPSSDHVMGKVTPKLKNQADHLIDIFKKGGVEEVFSADTHFYSRYQEPKSMLNMTTVGAVTSDRNPQTPRFAIVEVYTDGSYNVIETPLN